MTRRAWLWLATAFAVGTTAWVLGLLGCAFPAELTVRGALVRVVHEEHLESACPLKARLTDPNVCDVPPVCCAYEATVADATARREYFYAFWPRWAPGLTGLVALGDTATFHLHRHFVTEFPCAGAFGCQGFLGYVLESDKDVSK